MPRQTKGWGGVGIADLRRRWGREEVFAFGSVGSTNDVARTLADEGAGAGTIVLGRVQTAGRGRGGNEWASPDGAGAYVSMVFRPPATGALPLMSVIAGVDVALALRRVLPGVEIDVKWPNDLMARDRKLGGILVEASGAAAGPSAVVVGVGVNVRARGLPAGLDGAIALDELVDSPELVDVADGIVRGLERRLPDAPDALDEAALDEVDRLDWLRNRAVRHRLGDADPVAGTAAGIAPDGALLLRPDRGALRRVVAGSIEVLG
ncbi:MAG: biotin--[acetyl-CoA-carboxylase] ligase [Gemmatimonadetes bacterium]|nr:biotin--[acetyl-CoA-carboxylase] ligase [Gemmatimonadota bacterium]